MNKKTTKKAIKAPVKKAPEGQEHIDAIEKDYQACLKAMEK